MFWEEDIRIQEGRYEGYDMKRDKVNVRGFIQVVFWRNKSNCWI